jgi:hypothetical protein
MPCIREKVKECSDYGKEQANPKRFLPRDDSLEEVAK